MKANGRLSVEKVKHHFNKDKKLGYWLIIFNPMKD